VNEAPTAIVFVKRLSQFHSVETSTKQSRWSLANRGNICHRFSIREARLFCFVTDTEDYYSVVVSARLMLPDRRILTTHSHNSGCLLSLTSHSARGPGSVVGIATGYGMDGPGIESRWGRDFPHPSTPAPGAHPASCTMGTGSFPGVRSDRGVTLTPHPLLVPWSRKINDIPLLPRWALRPVQNLRGCTRVHFTFYFLSQCATIQQQHSVYGSHDYCLLE